MKPVGEMAVNPTFGCTICDGESARAFETRGCWIRECTRCGHQFAELAVVKGHVERTYGDNYFSAGDAGYADYLSEERLLIDRGRWYAKLLSRYGGPGMMLDVGAAAGFTLQGFADCGWQVRGIEPNAKMADYAVNQFNIQVQVGVLESAQMDACFDLVTMLQVLPHFIEPAVAIEQAAGCLRPQGLLLIETWDRASWTARLFGQSWHEYSPPSVLHWFSRAGLAQLLKKKGFTQIAQGRPSKWIDGAHAKSVLRSKAKGSMLNQMLSTIAGIVPDRLPVPYPAEDLFWALFRME